MATNPLFNPYNYSGEQGILRSLTAEVIQRAGMDMYYLPRRRNNMDKIYEADDMSSFDTAYTLEFYTESYGGFSGDQSFMAKFGVEVRDQIFFTCSQDRFQSVIAAHESFVRPREGDLIWFPLYGACFQIMYVDPRPIFYVSGILPQFKVTCELYEYSNEKFSTGIAQIDALEKTNSTDVLDYAYTDENWTALTDENGNVLDIESFDITIADPMADNDALSKASLSFVDFTELNPFGDIPQE